MGVLRVKIGLKEAEYTLSSNAKLRDLISKIVETHKLNIKRLLDEDKSGLDPSYIITVNGVAVNRVGGLNSELKDGDVVSIMSIISGG